MVPLVGQSVLPAKYSTESVNLSDGEKQVHLARLASSCFHLKWERPSRLKPPLPDKKDMLDIEDIISTRVLLLLQINPESADRTRLRTDHPEICQLQ